MKISNLLTYGLVAAGLMILGCIIFLRRYAGMQISPKEANTICNNFFDEVSADVNGVPGYTVVSDSKSCRPFEDEAGLQDYKPLVTLRVSTETMDSEATIKASMKELSDKMPQREYPIDIYNIPTQNGQPAVLCLISFGYIDNDGKGYPQGPPDHTYQYSALGPDDSSPCHGV